MWRAHGLGLFILLCLSGAASYVAPEGLSLLVSYQSPLDNSMHQYGVYLPKAPAPSPAGYPAVLHMHGYGWAVSANFSEFQQRWADEHGWILINVNARGPQFYEGVGDVETHNVLRDAHRRFGLDLRRIFVTGGSMGGTGAFRHGIRYPDIFAAVVGVDGWTDFREWHYHWYARTDQRSEIEEFRRPLLEAASPLYWAGRARWNAVQASVSGRDDVVLPENGILLYNALLARAQDVPGAYANRLFLDYNAGHGGSFRLEEIYNYFLHRQAHLDIPSFLCETPLLTHGQLYWGSMLRMKIQGAMASLESYVERDSPAALPAEGKASALAISSATAPPARIKPNYNVSAAFKSDRGHTRIRAVPFRSGLAALSPHDKASCANTDGDSLKQQTKANVYVLTNNLSEMAVHLQASPAAEANCVSLYADGFLAYEGPPRTVHLRADFSPHGELWGWQEFSPETSLRKTPDLEGPIGEAFKRPFIVAFGTAGPASEIQRNQREAEDFARGWNDFMIHAPVVVPRPEEQISAAELAHHSLILFGTEESSRLLREVNALWELPVHVRSTGVIVRDPQWGDRAYWGSQFGAFVCVPNPLAAFRQYLLICHGQWATKPDGTAWQGLEYDLEKLPWAYPDYVVFNSNQQELPFVLNVNNKPPVTCYEAAYFVEAGYFSQDWQPYRAVTLDRVQAQRLPTRIIHVEEMQHTEKGLRVRIVDAANLPVSKARVTVLAHSCPKAAYSAVTNEAGEAFFPAIQAPLAAEILNVMATGAEYDWQADRMQSTQQGGVKLMAQATKLDENGRCQIMLELCSDHNDELEISCHPSYGDIVPAKRHMSLAEGVKYTMAFEWRLPQAPEGKYRADVCVRAKRKPICFSRPVYVEAKSWPESPLRIVELKTKDILWGERWEANVCLANLDDEAHNVTIHLTLPSDRQSAAPQNVQVPPGKEIVVTFAQPLLAPLLDKGVHLVRAYVKGHRGVTALSEFTVK